MIEVTDEMVEALWTAMAPLCGDYSYVSAAEIMRRPRYQGVPPMLRVALAAALDAASGLWRDISTAPKDGTIIDLWTDGGFRIPDGLWMDGVWHFIDDDGDETLIEGSIITKWAPLPPPPKALDTNEVDHE